MAQINSGYKLTEAGEYLSNLLDYPEENGLKSNETEGRTNERYADQR